MFILEKSQVVHLDQVLMDLLQWVMWKMNFQKNTKVFLEVRGKKHPASICSLPFYKKSYVKGVN